MANIRSTVIMKTDLCGFTSRVKTLSETDLSALLNFHKEFVSAIAIRYQGQIVKGEGDSFWMIFPSVTSAALAAVEIQQELLLLQTGKGDNERLSIRAAISLGDVLHQDKDIFGDSVNLAARIESVTPAGETYLSQAAWLALNKAEVSTEFVDSFSLKGMSEPEKVYRINQQYKTRVIRDQVLVFTDLRKMSRYFDSYSDESQSIQAIEFMLTQLEEYIKSVCTSYDGTIRLIIGDAYLLTFSETPLALAALECLQTQWDRFIQQHQIPCPLSIGVHRGTMFLFRSAAYGHSINLTSQIEAMNNRLTPNIAVSSIAVSEKIQAEVIGTEWEEKLFKLEGGAFTDIHNVEHTLYQFHNDLFRILVNAMNC